MLEILGAIQRAALQGGVLLLVGAAMWKVWIARSAFRQHEPGGGAEQWAAKSELSRHVARIAGITALALIPIWILRGGLQLAAFRDPFAPLSEDVLFLLQETIFGPVWIAQGITLIVLALALLSLRRSLVQLPARSGGTGAAWAVVVLGAVVMTFTLAMSSHALSVEGNVELAVAADMVHTLAAGAWIGSLALILSTRKVPTPRSDAFFAAQLQAFSPVAIVCVTLLVAMGVFLGWQYLGTLSALWTTTYGRVLSAKVAVVGGVMLMGFLNWRKGMPAIDSSEMRSAVARQARWEVSLAVVVLILTGILTGTAR
jgi:putative copper resistance protein D